MGTGISKLSKCSFIKKYCFSVHVPLKLYVGTDRPPDKPYFSGGFDMT